MKYYLGIDLGGTNIAFGIVNENYEIIESLSVRTNALRGFDKIVAEMAEASKNVIKKAGLELTDISSVGIGAPGPINPVSGHVLFANNLSWRDAPLAEEYKKHIDIPVYLSNDADCAALGEYIAGAGKGSPSVLMVTLGTGVGGGLIRDGQIFAGCDGFGLELGHVKLVMDGVRCTCGTRGCFEAYASVTALIRLTIEAIAMYPDTIMREMCGNDLTRINGRISFDAAKAGDETGKMVVEQYIRHVGSGIGSMITAFRPHLVLIGGGISNEGEYLLAPVREVVSQTLYASDMIAPPKIIKAALGNSAGIIGAALLESQTGTQVV